MIKYWLVLIVLTVTVIPAPNALVFAQGDHYFFVSAGDDSWNTQANWQTGVNCNNLDGQGTGDIPSADDIAEICGTNTSQIVGISAVAKTVIVRLQAMIEIEASQSNSATLTLGSGSTALTSTILGRIKLLGPPNANDTTTATLTITAVDHTLGSAGFVEAMTTRARSCPSQRVER